MHSISAILSLVSVCNISLASDYPSQWWKPVPESEKKSWEILPQEAGPGEVILSKRTELGVFSNFAATSFNMDNETYASVEAFWQMMKFPEGPNDPRSVLVYPMTRDEVKALVAYEAKDAGKIASKNMNELGIQWISYKAQRLDYKGSDQQWHYGLIYRAIKSKIQQNPELKTLLMRTKGLVLRPDHHQGEKITPAYEYHKILMRIRDFKP